MPSMTPESTPAPWERLDVESGPAYAALKIYLDLGPERRSMAAVAAAVGKSKSLISQWSRKHAWVSRGREFDRHQAAVEQDALDRAISARVELWTARHFALCEDDYQTACELRKKAREILSLPGAEANWTGATAVSAAKIASELASASIDRAMHEPSLDDVDAAKLDPEAAARWMARFDLTERARRKAMLAASTPAE